MTPFLKLALVLFAAAISSTFPYLLMANQRYDYYMFLFSLFTFGAAFVLLMGVVTLPFGSSPDKGLAALKGLHLMAWLLVGCLLLRLLLMDGYGPFSKILSQPRGSQTLTLMRQIYGTAASQRQICLSPQPLIRKPRSDPYWPDDFWWYAAFGEASPIYAQSQGRAPIQLRYGPQLSDCGSLPAYLVDRDLKLRPAAAPSDKPG